MSEIYGGDPEQTYAPNAKPMDETEIAMMVDQWQQNAINEEGDELSTQREQALDFYNQEPYGDEEKGYSQTVTGEVMETVEWALPSIVRTFMTGEPCRFQGVGVEDRQAAEHETKCVNWVVRHSNPDSYQEFVTWLKDALLMPNGYLKVWWEKTQNWRFEEYQGLSEQAMASLGIPEQGEIVSVEMEEDARGQLTYSAVIRVDEHTSRIRFAAVPAEEVLIAPTCTSLNLDDADYVVHEPVDVTRSDLVAMGYDYDLVMGLETKSDDLSSTERTARRKTTDENSGLVNPVEVEMMERVDYVEAYGRIDVDGDGYAEYRKICKVGSEVLLMEYADMQPFCTLTCMIQPHRHVGKSLGMTAMTIQRENSALTRQTHDNLYRVNRPRAILGRSINRDEWDDYQPHGGVEGNPADYAPEIVPVAVQHVLPWLQKQDDALQGRTGVSKLAMGLDAETLAQSTMGAYLEAAGASSQRLETVIRTFAETGVAQMMLKVHALLRKHHDGQLEADLTGEPQAVQPREWKTRRNVVPLVGIGTGSMRERAAVGGELLRLQREAVPEGLATKQQVYNTLSELAAALGRYEVESYFTDPSSPEGQQIAQAMAQSQQQQQQAAQAQMQAMLDVELKKIEAKYKSDMEKMLGDMAQHRDKELREWAQLELESQADIAGRGIDASQVSPMTTQVVPNLS